MVPPQNIYDNPEAAFSMVFVSLLGTLLAVLMYKVLSREHDPAIIERQISESRNRWHYPYPEKCFDVLPLYPGPEYVLPEAEITDHSGRVEIIEALVPQFEASGFNYPRLLKTYYKQVKFNATGIEVWQHLSSWPLWEIGQFKKLILTAVIDQGVLDKNLEIAFEEVCALPVARTKAQILVNLKRFKNIHYLSVPDLEVVWSTIVQDGPFRELRNREKLLKLPERIRYNDFLSFVEVCLNPDETTWKEFKQTPLLPEGFPACSVNLDESAYHDISSHGMLRIIEVLKSIRDDDYTCPVCFSEVDIESEMWGCRKCCTVTHWKCFQEWCESQRGLSQHPVCVCCRAVCYRSMDKPATCWCRQCRATLNPVNPNSCGRICGFRSDLNGPKCMLPCHPGPHFLVDQATASSSKLCDHCLIENKSVYQAQADEHKKHIHF